MLCFWQTKRMLIAGIALLLLACSPPAPVTIGFLATLSGKSPALGADALRGARVAVEQRNQAGGINGRPIELIEADDEQNPETARTAMKHLIRDHRVSAVVGPMTSDMVMATLPQANESGVLMISPTATANELSGRDDLLFLVAPATRKYVEASAKYFFETRGLRRVRVIYDLRNRSYTESWQNDFSHFFAEAGGRLLAPLSFNSSDDTDFSGLAEQALADQPDGLILVADAVHTAMLCESLRKRHPTIDIGASEWASSGRLIELGGKSVEGVAVEHFYDLQSTAPNYLALRLAYFKRFGQEPGFGGLLAFQATQVLLDALEKKAPGQSLKQAILAQKTFAGVQSEVTFDANGDTQGGGVILVVKNGVFVPAVPAP